jgi:DNA-directed RNA polymerase subunit RPC12/RpoP
MQIQLECKNCGKLCVTDLGYFISTLIDTAEMDSVYSGYFCSECAEELFEDED